MSTVSNIVREDTAALIEALGSHLDAVAGTRFLVTGAGGFLCSYLVDLLVAWNDSGRGAPCRILAVDNFRSGLPQRVAHLESRDDVEFLRRDLSLPFELEGTAEFIVHGASIASPPVYRAHPLETVDVNVFGTRQMLELAKRGARSMIYLSTSEVYGNPDPARVPTSEDYVGQVACVGPRACYDESKRLGETLSWIFHRHHETPVKTVRPFNVYGPGQRIDDGRIIPDLMGAAIRGEPFTLFSDGMATRAFCYIRDFIEGMMLVLFRGEDGEPYNVGNDTTEVSIRQLAETFREVAGPPRPEIRFAHNPDPDYLTDNPQRRCPDLTKVRQTTGFVPKVDLKTGLDRTLRSYRELEVAS